MSWERTDHRNPCGAACERTGRRDPVFRRLEWRGRLTAAQTGFARRHLRVGKPQAVYERVRGRATCWLKTQGSRSPFGCSMS